MCVCGLVWPWSKTTRLLLITLYQLCDLIVLDVDGTEWKQLSNTFEAARDDRFPSHPIRIKHKTITYVGLWRCTYLRPRSFSHIILVFGTFSKLKFHLCMRSSTHTINDTIVTLTSLIRKTIDLASTQSLQMKLLLSALKRVCQSVCFLFLIIHGPVTYHRSLKSFYVYFCDYAKLEVNRNYKKVPFSGRLEKLL